MFFLLLAKICFWAQDIYILYLYLTKQIGSHLSLINWITFLFLLPYQDPNYNQLQSYSSLCFNCFRFVKEVNGLCWCGWLILLTITLYYFFIIFKRSFNFKLDYSYSAKIQIQLHWETIFLNQINFAFKYLLRWQNNNQVGPPNFTQCLTSLLELDWKTTYL